MNELKELLKQRDFVSCSKKMDQLLKPKIGLKKKNGEVATPYFLRKLMLDKIPNEFWKSKKKVLEPSCGKGQFVIDIIHRFYINLDIVDEEERYNTIINHCVYFSDINEKNIKLVKELIGNGNGFVGDTLKKDYCDFDLVVSNPPYNKGGELASGNTIYQQFTKKSLNCWLKEDGKLLSVHPSSWRKPNTKFSKNYGLFELMREGMSYLNINGLKDGYKTFNCGTRYDWFLIEKGKDCITEVVDEKNITTFLDLKTLEWLPNYNYDILKMIKTKDLIKTVKNTYDQRKMKEMSEIKSAKFYQPVVHSTPKSGIRYKYGSIVREHVKTPKVIFGRCGIKIFNVVIDYKGEYGITEGCISLIIENEEEGLKIEKALKSDKFTEFLKSCSWSLFTIEKNLFNYFDNSFWNYFI